MYSLLVVDLVPAAMILDLVERSSDGMEKTTRHISILPYTNDKSGNLRANDGQNERSPGQIARLVLRIVVLTGNST